MNCIIPGLNVKVLARAVQALAKIGDELFIEARVDKLSFLTFNQCKTVCGQYHLLESFFSQYSISENEIGEHSPSITCKIHMKTLLPVFKGTHLDKKLDFVKIEYKSSSDVIYFKIKYKCDDIMMSHTLRLMDPEILTLESNSENGESNICASSVFYNNLLALFSNSDDDITFEIMKDRVVARNYCTGVPHKPKFVRSQVTLNSSEFSIFQVKTETTINFSLKPFRTAIQFADTFNLNIGISFDKGGRPLSLLMKNPTFEVVFIVATLNPYADGHSTISATSLPTKITQVNVNGNHNITQEDLEALANENWDEFETDTGKVKGNIKKGQENIKHKKLLFEKNAHNQIEKESVNKRGSVNVINNKVQINNSNINLINNEKDLLGNIGKSKVSRNDYKDVVPRSPETSRSKKARLIFKRSYDPTYNTTMLNEILLPDSDSE